MFNVRRKYIYVNLEGIELNDLNRTFKLLYGEMNKLFFIGYDKRYDELYFICKLPEEHYSKYQKKIYNEIRIYYPGKRFFVFQPININKVESYNSIKPFINTDTIILPHDADVKDINYYKQNNSLLKKKLEASEYQANYYYFENKDKQKTIDRANFTIKFEKEKNETLNRIIDNLKIQIDKLKKDSRGFEDISLGLDEIVKEKDIEIKSFLKNNFLFLQI